jgi:hypothetical protein
MQPREKLARRPVPAVPEIAREVGEARERLGTTGLTSMPYFVPRVSMLMLIRTEGSKRSCQRAKRIGPSMAASRRVGVEPDANGAIAGAAILDERRILAR